MLASTQSFLSEFSNELRTSLLASFEVLQSETPWPVILAQGASKVLVSLAIMAVFYVLFLIFKRLFDLLFKRASWATRIARPVRIALRYVFILFAALALLSQYGISQDISVAVASAAGIGFLFYVLWIVATRLFGNYLVKTRLDPSLVQLFRNMLSVVIITLGVTSVLAQFGINVLTALAALGVVGVAVGFAAQDTLSNFIAGITLLIERPFRIGDWVKIDGTVGKVDGISLRNTRLKTRNNEITVMPNNNVANVSIINYSAGGPLRVKLFVGIAYKEQVKRAREIIMPLLESHHNVMKRPLPVVRLVELADSSLNLELHYWLKPKNIDSEPKISSELLEQIKEALDQAEIEIPFPHLQLFVDGAKGLQPFVQNHVAQE